jgi:hypothetical protein
MAMANWISKYPQVQALLSQADDTLEYSPDSVPVPVDEECYPYPQTCERCHSIDRYRLLEVAFADIPEPLELEFRPILCPLELECPSDLYLLELDRHSRRRPILLKINDLSHLAFVNIKSIESIIYAFYVASNGQVFN